MNIEEVRNIAKTQGLHPGKHSKTELIKLIQAEEGNFDCFATAYDGVCDQANCIWRNDCFAAAQAGALS
ncbi:MAG: SAP domain-containing protein [Gallionella sp.]